MTVALSVVVPIYNVEPHLEACLASIAEQTWTDLEVIMVDDGSRDAGPALAAAYAARDPRFRLIRHDDNQGPGAARNTGIDAARGRYLAFADGDDVLPRHAYALLAGSLEETGSDLAGGNARRFTSAGIRPSWTHIEPFARTLKRTHITAHTSLVKDRMVWNKVFRRAFWDAHGLRFPAGLYEDAPVVMRAHVLADAVDVLSEPVYYWREREGGARSITQRWSEPANFEDRMASVREISRFLAEHAPALKPAYDAYTITVDIAAVARAIGETADAARLLDLAGDFLDAAALEAFERVPPLLRLRCHFLRRRMVAELREVAALGHDDVRRLAVPRQGVLDDSRERTLRAAIDDAEWRDGRLRIRGHTTIDGEIRLWLRDLATKRELPLPVERAESRFTADIDPARLADGGRWRQSDWALHVAVTAGGEQRSGPVEHAAPGRASWLPHREMADGIWVIPADVAGARGLRVRVMRAFVTRCLVCDVALELAGRFCGPPAGAGTFVLSRPRGPVVEISATLDDSASFRVRLPLARLRVAPDVIDREVRTAELGPGFEWNLRLLAGGTTYLVAPGDGLPEVRFRHDDQEIVLTRTRYGHLAVLTRACRPVVDAVRRAPGDRLVLSGDVVDGAERPAELILRSSEGGEQRVPLTWAGRRFTAELTHPGDGHWRLLAATRSGPVAVVGARGLLSGLADDGHSMRLLPHHLNTLALRVCDLMEECDDDRGHRPAASR